MNCRRFLTERSVRASGPVRSLCQPLVSRSPLKCSSSGGLRLGRSLMHGVAPQMCGQVASPLLGCLDMSVQRQFKTSVCQMKTKYSLASSARASSVGGTSRPSALAVLRLIISSNFVFHAGLAKLPGLLGVALQSGVRWRRAAESAFRTPSASRSVVYTGVPGCCRQESSNPPTSTASKPSSSTSCRTTALVFASSPATGKAIRPGDP